MNKIFRKCRDFGLMVRLNNMDPANSLKCVKELKKANLPLCVINVNRNKEWVHQLKEVAFKEDLFIAAEGINNISEAYIAAANGAQFFILEEFNYDFMLELKENGFFYIPNVNNIEEVKLVNSLQIECVICKDSKLLIDTDIYNVLNNSEIKKLCSREIFSIIDLEECIEDYELWANKLVKDFLKLEYTEIYIKDNISSEENDFVKIFSATNKCKIIHSDHNSVLLSCSDFTRTVNYLKWRDIFIDPNNTESINGNIIKGVLDTKISNFNIILKENI